MKVFVTGASGFVGSAIVPELIRAGHEVTGFARSDSAAAAITKMGAKVHRGDLLDHEALRKGAAASDGVIHAGFIHDFTKFKENCEIDRRAIEVLGAALAGSKRPLIVTSGTALTAVTGKVSTEDDLPPTPSPVPRVASEEAARALSAKGVHASILRLPPTVHGDGDHGFVPMLIQLASEKGVAAYVGEGLNRWPAVHRLDAAKVYRLALEKAALGGCYHAVAEEGVPFQKIAEAIGRGLKLPVASKSKEEAEKHFGWFLHFASMDASASSRKTRDALGWSPTQVNLLPDLEHGTYFKS